MAIISKPTLPITWKGLIPSEVVTTAFGKTIQSLIKGGEKGQFPAPIRLRGKYFWVEADLDAWVEAQRQFSAGGSLAIADNAIQSGNEATATGGVVDGGDK